MSLDALFVQGLVVSYQSGVVYTKRTRAVAGAAPSAEGVFVPIGSSEQWDTFDRLLENEVGRGVSQAHADLIDEVLSQDRTTQFLRVDRDRLGESQAGWIFVRIGHHPERFPSPPFVATRASVADPESPVRQAISPIFGFGAAFGILTWPVDDAVSHDEQVSRFPSAPQSDHVSLRLAGPSYGWLSVELELGDYRLDLKASMVLNHPLREFFDWLTCDELSDQALRRVCLWREPEGYAVDVVAVSPESLSVRVWFDESFIPPMSGHAMMQRHRCSVKREVFSRAVARGLKEWLDSATDAELREGELERYRSMLDGALVD